MLEIRFGDLEIRGAPEAPTDRGLFVKPNGFQGWGALPASRREALARAVQHGEHDVPTYLPARVVTVDGWIIAEDDNDLWHWMDRITGLGATGDTVYCDVKQRGRTLHAQGRRLVAEVNELPRRSHAYALGEFQVQLVFAGPQRFGDMIRVPEDQFTYATVIEVENRGNFPAAPIVTFPEAPPSYSFSSPAGTFTVTGATPGGTHRINLATGRVTRSGVYMPGIGRGPLWAVPPAETWVHTLSIPGAVHLAPAFV